MPRKFHIRTLPLLLILPFTTQAQTPSPNEQVLVQMANHLRAQHNLVPLQWSPTLAKAAQTHAQRLIHELGELLHQYPGEPNLATRANLAGAHFSTIAENLAGQGESPAAIQQVWATTPTHRANLLDPNLTTIGIAVLESHGLLYAVEDFAHETPAQSATGITGRIAQLLQQHNISPTPSNDDAQKTCTSPNNTIGNPKLVIQWDGPEPTRLPDILLQQIATGSYTTAAIGICPGQQLNNQQFTTWHVAVLLY